MNRPMRILLSLIVQTVALGLAAIGFAVVLTGTKQFEWIFKILLCMVGFSVLGTAHYTFKLGQRLRQPTLDELRLP
jgi:hypothetical protein